MSRIILGVVIAIVLVALYVIAGNRDASDLEVGQITPDSPVYPATSIPYSLPQKTFVVTTTTAITACIETPNGEEIHGKSSVVVTSRTSVDPTQQYYVYVESGSRSKNLSYRVDAYDNGTLKSFSASIKDQVAPIAAATLGALVKVLPPIPGVQGLAGPERPPPVNCRLLNDALKQDANDPRLVLQQEDLWTPQASGTFSVDASLERLRLQFRLSNPRWAVENAIVTVALSARAARESPDIKFVAEGCKLGTEGCAEARPPLVKGLVLRNAARALLSTRVCDSICDALTLTPGVRRDTLLTPGPSREETVPQFGTRFLVRVHSGFAQDAALNVAMNPDGLITTLQVESVSSLSSSIATAGAQVHELTSGASGEPATDAAKKGDKPEP